MLRDLRRFLRDLMSSVRFSHCLLSFLSSAFIAFGFYHVHAVSKVTEGGILGLTLLLEHWFGISPAVSGLIMNLFCYALGFKLIGRKFLFFSLISSASFALFYRINELFFSPFWPQLADMPLFSALLGAIFVGVGAGICVRIGGAPSGDDALAMSLSHLTHLPIQWVYFICDLIVLGLSATYLPLDRLVYSLLTVLLSGQIIGLIQRVSFFMHKKTSQKKKNPQEAKFLTDSL